MNGRKSHKMSITCVNFALGIKLNIFMKGTKMGKQSKLFFYQLDQLEAISNQTSLVVSVFNFELINRLSWGLASTFKVLCTSLSKKTATNPIINPYDKPKKAE